MYGISCNELHGMASFGIKVLGRNPSLPGLLDHTVPALKHDGTDHNTKLNWILIHGESGVIQSLLYYVITWMLNWLAVYHIKITQIYYLL